VTADLAASLAHGLQQLQLQVTAQQQQQLLHYLTLLEKWNRVYNLTAIRDRQQMVVKHLLDSLSILPYVQGTRIIDVGTGAGLPGIPLAIVMPERAFVLLDSNIKKIRFLQTVAQQLALPQVQVMHGRVEAYTPQQPATDILSRAFSDLSAWLHATQHLGDKNSRFLAMKGVYPQQELATLPASFRLQQVVMLDVPLLNETRHLVCAQKRVD
jgi:16S rRNA (guanine527-N7)-methyltransferase